MPPSAHPRRSRQIYRPTRSSTGPSKGSPSPSASSASAPPDLPGYLAVVGHRIQQLRHESGLSQAEVARLASLTRPYLSAVEQGRQNITLEAALKIAGALRVPIARLLDGDR